MMRLHRALSMFFFFLAIVTHINAQQAGLPQMASLRPHQELRWHRVSPNTEHSDGPVLYQLLFNASGTAGTVPVFDSNPRHLINSPITVGGGNVAIGGLSISGGTGIITFAQGQTFPNSGVNSVTAGDNSITIGGTQSNPTVAVNTANIDGRYLRLTGGTLTGSLFGTDASFTTALNVTSASSNNAIGRFINSGTAAALEAHNTVTGNNFFQTVGVFGTADNGAGVGVLGVSTATTASAPLFAIGVAGTAVADQGLGVVAQATGSGVTTGLRAVVTGPLGTAGVFKTVNPSGKILSGRINPLATETEVFSVDGGGNIVAASLSGIGQQPLEMRVNNQRACRIEPQIDNFFGTSSPAPNIIAGYSGNTATGAGATIAGGGRSAHVNTVSGNFGTVGGGDLNTATFLAVVAGGNTNTASGVASAVAGGQVNTAGGDNSSIAGGVQNTASGSLSFVAGGQINTAGGQYSAVAGGQHNVLGGTGSFAAGEYTSDGSHAGVFLWGDNSTTTVMSATGPNQFLMRATNGITFYTNPALTTGVTVASGGGSWSSLSDRNVKANFAAIDGKQILARLVAMPVTTWNYQSQAASIRHIGPMAQDFFAAFNVGEDDRHITDIDEGGVALAAIQGLNQKLEEELRQKETRLAAAENEIHELKIMVQDLVRAKASHP